MLRVANCLCCDLGKLFEIPELSSYLCYDTSNSFEHKTIDNSIFFINKIIVNESERDLFDGSLEADVTLIKLLKFINTDEMNSTGMNSWETNSWEMINREPY